MVLKDVCAYDETKSFICNMITFSNVHWFGRYPFLQYLSSCKVHLVILIITLFDWL